MKLEMLPVGQVPFLGLMQKPHCKPALPLKKHIPYIRQATNNTFFSKIQQSRYITMTEKKKPLIVLMLWSVAQQAADDALHNQLQHTAAEKFVFKFQENIVALVCLFHSRMPLLGFCFKWKFTKQFPQFTLGITVRLLTIIFITKSGFDKKCQRNYFHMALDT